MYELLANLLIVLVAVLGLMRAIEWIIRSPQALKKSSEIYVQLSAYIDVQTLGWLLLIASSILLLSVFTREIPSYVLLVLGGLGLGTIFCFYGLASAESALFIATYYTTLTIGLYGYVLAGVGGFLLWKNRKKK